MLVVLEWDPDKLNKWYLLVDLVGFILNSTVLLSSWVALKEACTPPPREEDQGVFIKNPPVPEVPFKANPDFLYVNVL